MRAIVIEYTDPGEVRVEWNDQEQVCSVFMPSIGSVNVSEKELRALYAALDFLFGKK